MAKVTFIICQKYRLFWDFGPWDWCCGEVEQVVKHNSNNEVDCIVLNWLLKYFAEGETGALANSGWTVNNKM